MHTIILVLLILSYKVQSTPITICSSKKGSNLVQGNFRQPRNFSIASTYSVLFQCRSQRGLSVSGLNRINYNLDSSIILLYIYIYFAGERDCPSCLPSHWAMPARDPWGLGCPWELWEHPGQQGRAWHSGTSHPQPGTAAWGARKPQPQAAGSSLSRETATALLYSILKQELQMLILESSSMWVREDKDKIFRICGHVLIQTLYC